MNFWAMVTRSRWWWDPNSPGEFEQAAARLAVTGQSYPRQEKASVWALICMEVLDTELKDEEYERAVCELYARGITLAEIRELRAFAWRTAGWLNYDKMAWEWVHMDEDDIIRALTWQLQDGLIGIMEYEEQMVYMRKYLKRM